MSNQLFSNDTLQYCSQVTKLPAANATFFPSNLNFPYFAGYLAFRRNGSTVTLEILAETQINCDNGALTGDRAIIFGIGTVPKEFRPLGVVTKTVVNAMNMGGNFIKDFTRWVFLPDGNIVIVAKDSSYPDNPSLSDTPHFFPAVFPPPPPVLISQMGLTKNTITYCIN